MSTSLNPPQREIKVIRQAPIREFIGVKKGEILDGRGVGGDFHVTVDRNGRVHSTIQLPGTLKSIRVY